MNVAARRRPLFRSWWAVWAHLMLVLAVFARPRVLMLESRSWWAVICFVSAGPALVAAVAPWRSGRARANAVATVSAVVFAWTRTAGFLVGVDLTAEQRATGVATWLAFSVAVWIIGTCAAIDAARANIGSPPRERERV